MSPVDDDDDDDDVATRVAPARDLLPAHLHHHLQGGVATPPPAAGNPAIPAPIPAAGAPPPGVAPAVQVPLGPGAPMGPAQTAPGAAARGAATVQLGRRNDSLLDSAPRWVVMFNVACAVLTALGVLVLVILKVQGKW